jgi:hypothetical protein
VGLLDEARALPPLPLEEWEDSKETLHRYCQIVGKVRMEYSPYRNHWWHVTLYVTTRGLATGPIPYGGTSFDIAFDLLANRLAVTTSEGGAFSFALDDLTRFSGKRAQLPEDTDPVTRDAYSHEVISFGFWPGDREVREPTFYSYTAPEPQGLTDQPLHPQAASWAPEGGTVLLAYEEVRNSRNPKAPTRQARRPQTGLWKSSGQAPAKLISAVPGHGVAKQPYSFTGRPRWS